MRTVYFHEDDYCQQEILPLSNKAVCLKEMDEINGFSEDHRIPDIGFSDIYIRENPFTAELSSLMIPGEGIAKKLSFLPNFNKVFTGYGTYREECKRTRAVGSGDEFAIFWTENDAGLADALWLVFRIGTDNRETAIKTLLALGRLAPLMLADWQLGRCVDLNDANDVDEYISERINRNG